MKFKQNLIICSIFLLTGCTGPSPISSDPTVAGNPVTTTRGPKSPIQTLYTLELSLTVATNALADAHNLGIVTGTSYDKAKAIALEAGEVLIKARNAAQIKDTSTANILLTTLASLIGQIAVYNGDKK